MPKKHKRKLLEGGDHSQKRVQLKSSNDSTISDQHSSNLCNIRPEVKENVDRSRHLYQKGESNEWLQVFDQPFKCAVIDELVIEGDHFLHPLQQEIERHVRFHEKHNDLYRFKQSDDLKLMSHLSYCDAITRCLRQQLLPILAQATDIELFEDQIDITVSKYDRNDVLLCHDDLLEERRIAFIWYLVPSDWSSADAGELLLFSRDDNHQPNQVQRQLLPKRNSLIFFEVSPHSYHQVNEVLADRARFTVNGWFRGPKAGKSLTRALESFTLPIKFNHHLVAEPLLRKWINPLYLTDQIQKQVRAEFQSESQVSLGDFLDADRFKHLQTLLAKCDGWQLQGPANRRRYFSLPEDQQPGELKELIQVLTSEAMFLTLGNLTGLKLHPLNPEDEGEESPADETDEDEGDDDDDDDDDDDEDNDEAEQGAKDEVDQKTKESVPTCSSTNDRSSDSKCDKLQFDGDESIERNESQAKDGAALADTTSVNCGDVKNADDMNAVASCSSGRSRCDSAKCSARCNVEMRRYEAGCYTLIHDQDGEVRDRNAKLDVYLHLNHSFDCDFESGGFVEYVEKRAKNSEDEQLLTVQPQSNHLSLVYRDDKTLRFVKYLNATHQGPFEELSFIFQE